VSTRLAIAPTLELPLEVVTQKLAFLGTSGGGKTYGASRLAELMLEARAQIVVIDPVGVWYGLRVGAGGRGPGLEIPVLGGLHGDIALEPGAGELVANTVVETGTSVVLDVSMFRKAERRTFATAFAEQLFHRKKGHPSALHVFIEEAQTFLPQMDRGGESARMLGAFEDLTKIGRNFGIGHTLISQRPQAVNKDALNQVGTLFVFRTIAKQERRAIQDWIVEHDVEARIDELPKMPTGEAYVYSPAWLKRFERVRIGLRKTYDASATPSVGSAARAVRLADVDLDKLREAMKASVERAAADDPKKLRAEIAALRRDLERKSTGFPAPAPRRVEVPVASEKKLERVAGAVEKLSGQVAILQQTVAVWRALQAAGLDKAARLSPRDGGFASALLTRLAVSSEQARPAPASKAFAVHRSTSPSTNGHRLTKGERLMLTALAMHAPGQVSAPRAALLSGYSINSSTFRNILSQLRTAGYAAGDRAGLKITETGLVALGEFSPLPEGAELREYWLGWVGRDSAPGRVLQALIAAWPKTVARDELAERAAQSASSSTYRNALSTLRTLGLVHGRDDIAMNGDLAADLGGVH
jgi:uncharacterized protein DUF87